MLAAVEELQKELFENQVLNYAAERGEGLHGKSGGAHSAEHTMR